MSAEGQLLASELHKLAPSALVELYELDARPAGEDSILYFHNGNLGTNQAISFQGIVYNPLPIAVTGFEASQAGEPPRPKMEISNLGGFMSALVLKTQDLVGAKLTRILTFAKFLDTSPTKANVIARKDIYYIEQKVNETRRTVEFELASSLDLDGVQYPRREVTSGYCPASYRGDGCGFAIKMAVSDDRNVLFEGAKNFTGPWAVGSTYAQNDAVIWTNGSGFQCVFVSTSVSPITGAGNSPANTAVWKQVQRYRGDYDATVTDYVLNDVVSRNVNGESLLSISIWNGNIPAGQQPPNALFWKSDKCAKYLIACKDHYDSKRLNLPLPFNGFPGTINMPEV